MYCVAELRRNENLNKKSFKCLWIPFYRIFGLQMCHLQLQKGQIIYHKSEEKQTA
jgi:hypothetical protein